MEPVKLVTSKAFSQDELIASLLQLGVKPEETYDHRWEYYLRAGEATVWVSPDNREEHHPDLEVDALIESKLGGPPQTSVVLYISRNPGSEQLAMELAIRFAERWPCVLDNLSGLARRIFTLEELQVLYNNGLGLYEDEKGIPMPEEWYMADEEYITPEELEEIKKQNREFLEQEEKTFLGFDSPEKSKEHVQRDTPTTSNGEGNTFPGFATSEVQDKKPSV